MVLLVGVACYVSRSVVQGLALGALLATCAALPASLYIEHALRRDGLRRYSLPHRSERLVPLAIACASVVGAILLVQVLDAPRQLHTVLLTMLFVLGLTLAATPFQRISVHMAAVTGASVLLQLVFGSIGLAVLPVVAAVGWSRLELDEHTPAQVVAGAVAGAIGASVACAVLA